ncbi:DUF3551 domain-containing protein [Rhodopseudomonas sp. WA056]|uniref:DUF3551 domain-containing protein n=1 Tax=Rhodopseudomonas TaxID=1073 RepID=UPI00115ECED9|nr:MULTISPECIES: DUF3551 domain-containing protein [Rhodopseudomonas]NEW88267.1 DUF3551 domain-containing protein [Rhodopseudomonas sp. WA056]QDL99971.1 DUF3551 domain-containing protein [Rhodopseudomonas palustris]
MKSLALAAVAIGALGAAQVMTAQPAAAQVEYPYCKQGAQQGYPGNCSFVSFQSCRFSAQGTGGNCVMNPRYNAWGGGYGSGFGDAYGYAPSDGMADY